MGGREEKVGDPLGQAAGGGEERTSMLSVTYGQGQLLRRRGSWAC